MDDEDWSGFDGNDDFENREDKSSNITEPPLKVENLKLSNNNNIENPSKEDKDEEDLDFGGFDDDDDDFGNFASQEEKKKEETKEEPVKKEDKIMSILSFFDDFDSKKDEKDGNGKKNDLGANIGIGGGKEDSGKNDVEEIGNVDDFFAGVSITNNNETFTSGENVGGEEENVGETTVGGMGDFFGGLMSEGKKDEKTEEKGKGVDEIFSSFGEKTEIKAEEKSVSVEVKEDPEVEDVEEKKGANMMIGESGGEEKMEMDYMNEKEEAEIEKVEEKKGIDELFGGFNEEKNETEIDSNLDELFGGFSEEKRIETKIEEDMKENDLSFGMNDENGAENNSVEIMENSEEKIEEEKPSFEIEKEDKVKDTPSDDKEPVLNEEKVKDGEDGIVTVDDQNEKDVSIDYIENPSLITPEKENPNQKLVDSEEIVPKEDEMLPKIENDNEMILGDPNEILKMSNVGTKSEKPLPPKKKEVPWSILSMFDEVKVTNKKNTSPEKLLKEKIESWEDVLFRRAESGGESVDRNLDLLEKRNPQLRMLYEIFRMFETAVKVFEMIEDETNINVCKSVMENRKMNDFLKGLVDLDLIVKYSLKIFDRSDKNKLDHFLKRFRTIHKRVIFQYYSDKNFMVYEFQAPVIGIISKSVCDLTSKVSDNLVEWNDLKLDCKVANFWWKFINSKEPPNIQKERKTI